MAVAVLSKQGQRRHSHDLCLDCDDDRARAGIPATGEQGSRLPWQAAIRDGGVHGPSWPGPESSDRLLQGNGAKPPQRAVLRDADRAR
jgi:hypothetical protein